MGDGVGLTFLFAALLIGGLVLLVLVGVRALLGGISHPDRPHGPAPSLPGARPRSEARQLLDERYARGELTTEEYHEHVDDLGGEA